MLSCPLFAYTENLPAEVKNKVVTYHLHTTSITRKNKQSPVTVCLTSAVIFQIYPDSFVLQHNHTCSMLGIFQLSFLKYIRIVLGYNKIILFVGREFFMKGSSRKCPIISDLSQITSIYI